MLQVVLLSENAYEFEYANINMKSPCYSIEIYQYFYGNKLEKETLKHLHLCSWLNIICMFQFSSYVLICILSAICI